MTVAQAFEIALQHHQAGRLAEAEALYRQILAVEPQHADALHLLGVIAHQVGRSDLAVEMILKAIAVVPGDPVFNKNLGEAYRTLRLFDEAIVAFRRSLAGDPGSAVTHSNLGAALAQSGQIDEAVSANRHAIQLKPDYAEAHSNLGAALGAQGQLDEAVAAYRRAIQLKADYAEAHNNLGNGLRAQGQLDEAVAACRRAIQLKPDLAEAHNNLGAALTAQGQLDEALAACRRAIQLKPDLAEAHSNLGNALTAQGQLDEAVAAYRRAIQLKPDYAEAHSNLGNGLTAQGQLDEAVAAYRRAIQLKPDLAEAHNNLGNALKDMGLLEAAMDAHRRAIQFKPDFSVAHSNLLFGMHYLPVFDEAEMFAEHVRWGEVHAKPLAKCVAADANGREPERQLRVGYVSADFREHSMAYFFEGLLANHDRPQVGTFCYADVACGDGFTERLRGHAGQWRRITGMSDGQVAEMIRGDRIDILVDLSGHTAGNRLLVFARKPAPVQVTWLGYPDTTGMEAMDWRFTDAFADPSGMTEHLHTEKLVRLPGSAWCFRPSDAAPSVEPAPAERTGHVTFGCFNAMAKITCEVLALWGKVLEAVPGSRLLLKNGSLGEASVQARVRESLAGAGVRAERVEFMAKQAGVGGHLAVHGRVDIALDTYPYHGTTTTCEALWMGVPVVTLAGRTHVSRVGVSLLTNAGLPDLIARTPEEYVELAAKLAGNVARLSELRATLRERMRASPLMDAPRFARNVEQAYREMWRAWCAKRGATSPAGR